MEGEKKPGKSSAPEEITTPVSSEESTLPEDESSPEDSSEEMEHHLDESDGTKTESLEASGKPDNWFKRLFAWFGSLFTRKERELIQMNLNLYRQKEHLNLMNRRMKTDSLFLWEIQERICLETDWKESFWQQQKNG